MSLQQLLESSYAWLMAGGIGTILTTILTLIITKSRKKHWVSSGRDESFDDILTSLVNLTIVVTNMTEVFIMVFSTSKNVLPEVKIELENKINQMRKDAVFKISKTAQSVIELAKEKNEEAKSKAKEMVDSVKEETEIMLNTLKKESAEKITNAVNNLLK